VVASPKLEPVVLSDEERSVLTGWSRRRKTAQALALRSRIVLACAEPDATIAQVAERLEISRATVSKWRSRFLTGRLEGLSDEPRPGRPRMITDEAIEAVVVKTLEETPGRDTHWSTRSMAGATGLSQSSVSRIWRAFGLKPQAVQSWKLSTDPQFIDKVRDVVGIYLDPPTDALVLAVDELGRAGARHHSE
jgi:transposase-like protein